MTEKEIIYRLWELGHFFNPLFFSPGEVKLEDIAKFTAKDEAVKKALMSWKDMMALDLDRLSLKHYERMAIHDGDLDPATIDSFNVSRCGMPDYYEGVGVKVGSGSWPEPCQKAGITFSVNKSGQPSNTAAAWEEILNNVVKTYAKVGARLKPYSGTGNANIRVSWRGLAGSTIGLAEFNNRSCSDSVFCYLDTGFNSNKYAIMDLLCHEMGHNMNLNHTRGGIMNASLGSVNSFSGWTPNDPSWSTLVRFFGGEPLDDDIPPTPLPGNVEFRLGEIFVDNKSVGKMVPLGGIDYKNGNILVNGTSVGRLIMIPPF